MVNILNIATEPVHIREKKEDSVIQQKVPLHEKPRGRQI
jgi:hypothetical protein